MDINFTDLEKLIKLAERSEINALEVSDGDKRISIICQPNGDEVSHHKNSNPPKRNTSANDNSANDTLASSHSTDENSDKKPPTEDSKKQVLAPMLGSFFRRSAPSADEFVKVGNQVEKGQTLCIVEAMKMMHEVKADIACTIKEILIEEGDVVEYGQALFTIEPIL